MVVSPQGDLRWGYQQVLVRYPQASIIIRGEQRSSKNEGEVGKRKKKSKKKRKKKLIDKNQGGCSFQRD
ncbi:hypothetical protein CR513_58156, partial [Mucuna pruriens]